MDDPAVRSELESRVGRVVYLAGPMRAGDLAGALAGADGLIAGLDELSEEVFGAAPRLRVVARYGVGTDCVDLHAAAAHGVTVTTTPGANANAVAELTVALLFALARPLHEGRVVARGERWPALPGTELSGRVLGLVGLGRIGSLVAAKCAALGMQVQAHDPYLQASVHAPLVGLEELLGTADFVSLHAPLGPQTRGMMGRPQFEAMKPGTALVNTARGGLVDEAALLWALDSGRLRAAALDVMAEEPPSATNAVGRALLERENVIVTPHMGPHTAEATRAMGRMAVEELLAVLSNQPPQYPVICDAGAARS